jgi:hypothetical protein
MPTSPPPPFSAWRTLHHQLHTALHVFAVDHVARGRMCALKSQHVALALVSLAAGAGVGAGTPAGAAQAAAAQDAQAATVQLQRRIQEAMASGIADATGEIAGAATAVARHLAPPQSAPAVPEAGGGMGARGRASAPVPTPAAGSEVDRLLAVIQLVRDENEALLKVRACLTPCAHQLHGRTPPPHPLTVHSLPTHSRARPLPTHMQQQQRWVVVAVNEPRM